MAQVETHGKPSRTDHRPPLWRRMLWYVTWALGKPLMHLFYGLRIRGPYLPQSGGTLVLANHQSFVDPILIGFAAPYRPNWSVARKTLWGHKPLVDKLLDSYNAFPINIEDMDMAAMRRCIEIMKAGQTLVMYPEGTRTADGQVGAFAPGLMLLIKRAKPRVIPVAIDGAFEVWSRHMKKPKLTGKITVTIGEPIKPQTLLAMPPDQAVAMIRDQVVTMLESSRT